MGNNGIWGLEKHPMEFLYGYSVAAELQPECRYDKVVEALGGHGELVQEPDELVPALERAFACGKPALVNVLTDPSDGLPAPFQPRVIRRAPVGRVPRGAADKGLHAPEKKPPGLPAVSFNGPIRTGRGTCLEGTLRSGRREAPIRCGFARTYAGPKVSACALSRPRCSQYSPRGTCKPRTSVRFYRAAYICVKSVTPRGSPTMTFSSALMPTWICVLSLSSTADLDPPEGAGRRPSSWPRRSVRPRSGPLRSGCRPRPSPCRSRPPPGRSDRPSGRPGTS